MKITLKLYAQLGQYLPQGTNANEADIEVEDATSVLDVLTKFNLPLEMCHLVLVNGSYIAPDNRGQQILQENDHLAVWPPIAGG